MSDQEKSPTAVDVRKVEKAAKLWSRAGWAIFIVLLVGAILGYGTLSLAKVIGVAWLAYYFARFSGVFHRGQDIANHQHAIVMLGTLAVVFAWGQFKTHQDEDDLFRKIETICRSASLESEDVCAEVSSEIEQYRAPADPYE